MKKSTECNYACSADPAICTPSEKKITEQEEDVPDPEDQLIDELSEQEERERDEFAKRWEDIDYLVQKPFCCK